MITHDLSNLLRRGFTPLDIPPSPIMPSWGRLRRLAMDLHVHPDAVVAIRTAPDTWECFLRPGKHPPFEDTAILGRLR